MSENKQTAVEWLLQELYEQYRINLSVDMENKALQMEREQIEEAYGDGYIDRHSDELTVNNEIKNLKP